jgi:hypothetical protein
MGDYFFGEEVMLFPCLGGMVILSEPPGSALAARNPLPIAARK